MGYIYSGGVRFLRQLQGPEYRLHDDVCPEALVGFVRVFP